MLTINPQTPRGVAMVLMCALLLSYCQGGRALGIEEEAPSSAVSSSSALSEPSGQSLLVARTSSSSSRASTLQVAIEMLPTAFSLPQRSTAHATQDYTQLSYELRQRIYREVVLRNELSVIAFGKQAWGQHFGDVGKEPPLPRRVINILDSPCPFWTDQKVKNTHLLVLIPATVNGERFTLNKLGELISRQLPNNEDGYRYYDSDVQDAFGDKPLPEAPYWLLITRDVLKGSRHKAYSKQQAMVSRYSSHGYRLPYGLEAATSILAHYVRSGERKERLFGDDPWTYTRCTATQLVFGHWSLIVGGFESTGLDVYDDFFSGFNDIGYDCGVACCRKL